MTITLSDTVMQALLPPIAGRPIDLLEYGNSFTARGYSPGPSPIQTAVNGLAPMLEAMSGGQLRMKNVLTNMAGFSGTTSTYLLTNFATNVAANFANFDWLLMWGWAVNDLASSISPATSLANIQSIAAQCRAAGKTLLLGNGYYTRTGNYALTTATGEPIAALNRAVGVWARKTPGVIYFDFWNDVASASLTTGASYGNLQDSDGLHPASLGVQYVAKRCLMSCQAMLTGVGQTMGQLDVYDATNNPGGNLFSTLGAGAMQSQGTSGAIGSGCSGQAPAYWSVVRSSGSDTVIAAKIPAVSGFGSSGGDQFSVGVNGSTATLLSALQAYPNCPAGLVGQQVELLINMTMPTVTTGIGDVLVQILPNYAYGSQWGLRADLLSATYWMPGNYLIRTPPLTVPSGTTTFQIQLLNTFLTGTTAAVTYTNPVLRLVAQ